MIELAIGAAAVATFAVLAIGCLLCDQRRRAWLNERRSGPSCLWDAERVHIGKTFRTTSPVPIAAKLDRAYRLPSGTLVLVELKTRRTNNPSFSDVIQLSAQRAALSGAAGQTFAAEAIVLIARCGVRRSPIAQRVEQLSADQVVALVRRREAILSNRISPHHAADADPCHGCTFRSQCNGADRPRRP